MIKFNKNSLNDVKDVAIQIYTTESIPSDISPSNFHQYALIKAFCTINQIDIEFDLNRKYTESIED